MDNLQSWRNVETILANPELYRGGESDYLSQFRGDPVPQIPIKRMISGVEGAEGTTKEIQKDQDQEKSVQVHATDSTDYYDTTNQEPSSSECDWNGNSAVPKSFSAETEEIPSESRPLKMQSTSEVARERRHLPQESEQQLQQEETNTASFVPPRSSSSSISTSTSTAPSSRRSSSIFPNFVRVTYPDPVTNQFTSSERSPRSRIQVASKYATTTTAETKRTRECPDVEPLFVDQPLARISIDYELMSQTRTEYDEMVEEGILRLADEERKSLQNHENYLREVDRIYTEYMQPKEQANVGGGGGEQDKGEGQEEEEGNAGRPVKQWDKESWSTFGASSFECSGGGGSDAAAGRLNLLADLDKLFTFDKNNNKNNKIASGHEPRVCELVNPGSSAYTPQPATSSNGHPASIQDDDALALCGKTQIPEIHPKSCSSSSIATSTTITTIVDEGNVVVGVYPDIDTGHDHQQRPASTSAAASDSELTRLSVGELAPLRDPFTNRSYPSTSHPIISDPSPALVQQKKKLTADDDEDATWILDYLNDTDNCLDVERLSNVSGTIRQLSRERLAQIRQDNERIVASIKRLYDDADKSDINVMRRNLGAVKKVLMNSQAINELEEEQELEQDTSNQLVLPLPVIGLAYSSGSALKSDRSSPRSCQSRQNEDCDEEDGNENEENLSKIDDGDEDDKGGALEEDANRAIKTVALDNSELDKSKTKLDCDAEEDAI